MQRKAGLEKEIKNIGFTLHIDVSLLAKGLLYHRLLYN
jgi:hypothetical protein